MGSTTSDEPSTLAISRTELLATTYRGSSVHSSLSVTRGGDDYATVNELSQNETGGIDKITRRQPRGGGRDVLQRGEAEPASAANVVGMVREAMGYAKPLPQPRPEWRQELSGYSNMGSMLVASERMVPLYSKLLGMVGRAIMGFDSQDATIHLDVEARAAFRSSGHIRDYFRNGQGVKISASNWERRQDATFTLRLGQLDFVRNPEHCFVEECSLRTVGRSKGRVVITEDRLVIRQDEAGVLFKRTELPGNKVSVTTHERVQDDERILQMASMALGLVAGSPLPTS